MVVGDPPRSQRDTPSIRKKLALTSPTSGGRSVGIVCSRAQATEFVCIRPNTNGWHHAGAAVISANPLQCEGEVRGITLRVLDPLQPCCVNPSCIINKF
jgi:hypothetical protein